VLILVWSSASCIEARRRRPAGCSDGGGAAAARAPVATVVDTVAPLYWTGNLVSVTVLSGGGVDVALGLSVAVDVLSAAPVIHILITNHCISCAVSMTYKTTYITNYTVSTAQWRKKGWAN